MTDGESLWTLASPCPDDAHSDSWKTHSGRSGQAEQRLLTTLYLFVPDVNQALLEIRPKCMTVQLSIIIVLSKTDRKIEPGVSAYYV